MTIGAKDNVTKGNKTASPEYDQNASPAVPHSVHAVWFAPKNRQDPIEILRQQEKARIPELLPLRRSRMAASAFSFYRGAAAIMAADLAKTPTSGITVQACGDAHLSNFGGYAAPDRRLVFDVNDFDETLPAPWEWDVKRLAASLVIAGRDRGISEGKRAEMVLRCVRSYRESMRKLADMDVLDVWYLRVDVENALAEIAAEHPKIARKQKKASGSPPPAKDNLRALGKLTEKTADGVYQFKDKPPLLVPGRSLPPMADGRRVEDVLAQVTTEYAATLPDDRKHLFDQFTSVDLARKVVGVGSVGTKAWVVLLTGRDSGDPLFLQVKQADASVMEPFVGASAYRHAGQRVVEGQRLLQTATDIFLGWATVPDTHGNPTEYYVRQLWDGKSSVDVDRMTRKALSIYGELCGATLARAHARSGDRAAIARYLGNDSSFDVALVAFAEAYANQNESDYQELLAALKDGRMKGTDATD